MFVRLVALISLVLNGQTSIWANDAYIDEPVKVRLYGKVERHIFAGPPNFENVRKGDEPRRTSVLRLSRPLTLSLNGNKIIKNGTLVQLIVVDKPYSPYSRFKGKYVQVEGHMFLAESAMHYTPFVIIVDKIIEMKKRGNQRQ